MTGVVTVTYRLAPAATTYPGSTAYPGVVGAGVELQVLIDLGDPTDPNPNWQYLAADRVRACSISRGRESELDEMDAGTSLLTVDNRDRAFDPTYTSSPYYPYIRPMTRFMILAEIGGTDYPLLVGYAGAFQQRWTLPDDAVTEISLTDEFKILSLDRLPTTNPPRDSYRDVVAYDNPTAYWPMDDPAATLQSQGSPGPTLTAPNGLASVTGPGAIVGETEGSYQYLTSGNYLAADAETTELNVVGLADGIAYETWFYCASLPAAVTNIARGPLQDSGEITWQMLLQPWGSVHFAARNALGTTVTVTSSVWLAPGLWYHLAGVYQGGALRIYVNGVETDSDTFTNTFNAPDAGTQMIVGDPASTISMAYDEMVFYRYGPIADRVAAHFTAGRNRGFARNVTPGTRIDQVLDASASVAPRHVRNGVFAMTGAYMTGQDPLSEIRQAVRGDQVDAVFFVANDGTNTFLDSNHRSILPHSQVQATFGDGGGSEIAYVDLTPDYSESFLANEWNVTRTNGLTQTASDATSIDRYFKRPQSITDMPVTQDTYAAQKAASLLAKYKDPLHRIQRIGAVLNDPDVAATLLSLDLCDRIRILRTPPGGGERYDQTSFIQKVSLDATPHRPWRISWVVSPV